MIPEPGTTPVGGDCAGPVDVNKVIEPGSQMIPIKAGSIEDVNAVGNRDIGKRGMGNWYSTDGEIKMGKQYADEVEKRARSSWIDPVVDEYVNRIGQNIVKNSDCKVPFTIKVIDSDEINAFALPGGFFYVNSGLILAADEEAELAGVMAHEISHVCAHHVAREMTRLKVMRRSAWFRLEILLPYDWTGYGIYEAAQLAIPYHMFLGSSRAILEACADYLLGVQYMYWAGYDPQAFITFFEKRAGAGEAEAGARSEGVQRPPADAGPDSLHTEDGDCPHTGPAKDDYLVTTSEFDDVKCEAGADRGQAEAHRQPKNGRGAARCAGQARLADGTGSSGGLGEFDPVAGGNSGDTGDGPPTLHRRDDQN